MNGIRPSMTLAGKADSDMQVFPILMAALFIFAAAGMAIWQTGKADRHSSRVRRLRIPALGLCLALCMSVLTGCTNAFSVDIDTWLDGEPKSSLKEMKVHFIDVGQADSIFIELPDGKNMLIDAGNNADGAFVARYLSDRGVTRINYLIGTHPHADHIGGLDTIINEFDIVNVLMPKVSYNTKTYEDVLKAVKNKGLRIISPVAGEYCVEVSNYKIEVLAPCEAEYEDINNYSIVVKITIGERSFLFCGDAEALSEEQMLERFDIGADVVKLGHHGSATSSSEAFLDAVNPEYAVIMCGADNDYGHPHEQTLDRLAKRGIGLYRTDINGTIVMTTDGQSIDVVVQYQPGEREGNSLAGEATPAEDDAAA